MILPFWQRLLSDPAKLASIVFDTASSFGDNQPIETLNGTRQGTKASVSRWKTRDSGLRC